MHKRAVFYSHALVCILGACGQAQSTISEPSFTLDDSCDDIIVIPHEADAEAVQMRQEATELLHTKTPPTLPCQEVVAIITNPDIIELQKILAKDFYSHTNPIVMRPLQDEPSLQLPIPLCGDHEFAIIPFYYQTNRGYYTAHGTQIKDYIPLIGNLSDDFIELIDLKELIGVSVPEVLELFSPLRIEHRRLGAMLAYSGSRENWTISAALPIFYQEVNFQLTDKEKERIEQAPFFTGFQFGTAHDLTEYTYQHLAADQAGWGDLRIRGWYTASAENGAELNVGGEITLPTAVAIQRGLVFGAFNPAKAPPPIDFALLLGLIFEANDSSNPVQQYNARAAVVNMSTDIFTAVLDHLSTALCNKPLGQQHVSFGPLVRAVTPTCRWGNIELYAGVDYYAPATEWRMFRPIKTAAEFDRDWSSDDEAVACANLQFLETQAENSFYPPFTCIKVTPGIVAKGSIQWSKDDSWYHLNAGVDFWGQAREKLHPSKQTQLNNYDLEAGRAPEAHQTKVFGGVMFKYQSDHHASATWNLGLKGEYTVQTRGMGKEWGAVAYISVLY